MSGQHVFGDSEHHSGDAQPEYALNSYSQFGEDLELYTILHKEHGCIVEVGAFDGYELSNSLFFEERGWRCILVEPNPLVRQSLSRRTKAEIFFCAAGASSGQVEFVISEGAEEFSSMAGSQKAIEMMSRFGGKPVTTSVPVRTLNEILAEAKVKPPIDIISIDVEGRELDVIQGLDISVYKPQVVLIEDNSEGEDLSIATYMKEKGYFLFKRTGCNDWFVHSQDPLWGDKSVQHLWRTRKHYSYKRKVKRFLKWIWHVK